MVARRGQAHHNDLKRYFLNPASLGAYLVADLYTKHIAAFAKEGYLNLPEEYKKIAKQYCVILTMTLILCYNIKKWRYTL